MRKDYHRLGQTIHAIQEGVLEHIEELNFGGCGWFTYLVGKELKRRGIPFTIMVLEDVLDGEGGWTSANKVDIKQYFNGRGNKFRELTCTHYLVKVGNYSFDGVMDSGRNEEDVLEYYYQTYGFELEIAEETHTLQEMWVMLNKFGWNSRYNKAQNRRLQLLIREAFRKYYDTTK